MKLLRLAALSLALAAPASGQTITAVKITDEIVNPTFLTSPAGDSERVFVTDKRRGIHIIKNGVLLPDLFLDLSPVLNAQGIMSMAFHPDYATNGKFYVVYLDVNQEDRLVEYTVSPDPDVADPASARVILGPFLQPAITHNWDLVQFGPDGMLYLSTGDGYLSSDDTQNTSQDLGSILGKVLRLDPDLPPPHIPADNPFVGVPGAREEVWLYGVRQPWRYSWDRATDDLWIADVGDGHREELNFLAAGAQGGQNLGWRCIEGTDCKDFAGCVPNCADPTWTDPIHEFDHSVGCAIIGGYVYRGSAIPSLQGAYLFADHCTGKVWSLRYDGVAITALDERSGELAPADGSSFNFITSFGEDADGELYILSVADGGGVFKIMSEPCFSENYCVTSPNSVGTGATISREGLPSVSLNNFTLTADGSPPGQFGVFFYGPEQTQAPMGDGFRCILGAGVGLFRLNPPQAANNQGHSEKLVDFTNPPTVDGTITPGSTWNFQLWYRDPAAGGSGFNLSDGLSVTFCP